MKEKIAGTGAPFPDLHLAPVGEALGDWHALSPSRVIESFGSSIDVGLTVAEAERRLASNGENRLAEAPSRSALAVLLAQFKSVFVLVLAGAATIAGVAGDIKDASVIVVVVLLNALLGFYQEYRAEKSLLALRRMLPRKTRVRRDGSVHEIGVEGVVTGDLLLVEAGDKVAADGRLILSAGLQIDESGLTGESEPVFKDHANDLPARTSLADRRTMAFMNTVVTRGRGEIVVTATGMSTAIGSLSKELAATREPRSPLQRQLDDAGKRLGLIAIVLVGILLSLALARGEGPLHVVLESVSLAVAAIPEGLPAVVTITLALGMRRMARRHALVKRLASVETLGCATVICSDKTGTLTVNQMTVRAFTFRHEQFSVSGEGYGEAGEIVAPFHRKVPNLAPLLLPLALCNDSGFRDGQLIGDPTEGALLVLVRKGGMDAEQIRQQNVRLAELPFDSLHKFMATAHRDPDGIRLYVKGAPDILLERCTRILAKDGSVLLDEAERQRLLHEYRKLASTGLRGLLIADAVIPEAEFNSGSLAVANIGDLRVLGLLGLMDPPRLEARQSIAAARSAGVSVKMITGDHPGTALAVARDLGLEGSVLTGAELEALSEEELSRCIGDYGVFARVVPEHKVRIVRALKAEGHVVAMTGDGVNDAPALKTADIGIAMGRTGTEVAKEAAAMVLTNDNFSTIIEAIHEGRTLYDNIVKFVRFQLSTTAGAIMTVFAAPLLGLPDPLTPIQILWVAMIMDGPPAVSLALDSARPGLMQEPPRSPDAQILSAARLSKIVLFGATMMVGTLTLLWHSMDQHTEKYALTLAFTTFVLFQVFNVFNARAEWGTSFNRNFFNNLALWLSLAGIIVLQGVAIYWTPASSLFGTVPLAWPDLALAIAVASSVLLLEESRKAIVRLLKSASASLKSGVA